MKKSNNQSKIFIKNYFEKISLISQIIDINELNKAGFEYQESVNLSLEEDFLILFSADKLVCSNSTLCFWAAALGKSSKSVIPSHLIFRNKKEKNTLKFFDKDIVIIPASYD